MTFFRRTFTSSISGRPVWSQEGFILVHPIDLYRALGSDSRSKWTFVVFCLLTPLRFGRRKKTTLTRFLNRDSNPELPSPAKVEPPVVELLDHSCAVEPHYSSSINMINVKEKKRKWSTSSNPNPVKTALPKGTSRKIKHSSNT